MRQLGQAVASFTSVNNHRYPEFFAYPTDFKGPVQEESFHVQLLPYLDGQALYNKLNHYESLSSEEPPAAIANVFALSASTPFFVCPADSARPGATNYRICYGTSPGIHATWKSGWPPPKDVSSEALKGIGLIRGRDAKITDGLSNTVLFSERIIGDGDPARYDSWRDVAETPIPGADFFYPNDAVAGCSVATAPTAHRSFVGWTWLAQGYTHTGYNHVLGPNGRIPDCFDGISGQMGEGAMTARSMHPGGVNVSLADGAARFVNEAIDLSLWRALGSYDGGEIIGQF